MKWHSGQIQNAIAEAKQSKKIFLVYVEGKDPVSQSVNVTYESPVVGNEVDKSCIAVKISIESEQFKQFSQIYPVIVVPSSFLIGSDGIPLEVIGGALTPEEFVAKIRKAEEMHISKLQNLKSHDATTSTGLNNLESAAVPVSINETPGPEGSSNIDLSLDEKVERAKQLVEERRVKKMKEEQEKAKEKELEHRRIGQEIQRAKQQQQEREMAEWAQQMRKDKEDTRLARERVKAQIAQDRADRAARYGTPNTDSKKSESPQTRTTTAEDLRQRSAQTSSDHTRIQFRLPNATNRTQEFSSNAKLEEIFQFIDKTIQPGFSNYTLATTFSRCNYTRRDSSRSLIELELVPSAVLLIVPTTGTSSASSSSLSLIPFLTLILSPFVLIWNMIQSLFGRQPTPVAPPVANSTESNLIQKNQNDSRPGTSANSRNSPKAKGVNSSYKKDGNVHRLANDSMDDDDENNTWNGNSTQQL